jgi:hypothetical protein
MGSSRPSSGLEQRRLKPEASSEQASRKVKKVNARSLLRAEGQPSMQPKGSNCVSLLAIIGLAARAAELTSTKRGSQMFVTHLVVTFPCTDQEGANEAAKVIRDLAADAIHVRYPMASPQIEVKIQCNEGEEAIRFKAEGE